MGLHCLLISINQVQTPYVVHPLGMAHIAGALEEAGHFVRQYDVLAEGGLSGLDGVFADQCFDVVGISIRNIDTVDSADPQFFLGTAFQAISEVKRKTDAPIILGGGAFTLFPELIMQNLKADYGVMGEGEIAVCDLVGQIEKGTAPARGTILRGTSLSTGAWQSVKYDPMITDYYSRRGGMLNVQTKRGCPFRCDYCSYPTLEGNVYRYRDPKEVVDEVERIKQDFGCKYLFFTDSVFNDLKNRYLEICEELIRRGNKMPWCGYFRPSHLTKEALQIMKRSGLHAMEFGTDAASDQTLAGMHKAFRMDDVFESHRLVRELDIPAAHFVIFGGPEETNETLREGLENMRQLNGAAVFGFSGIRILPHAPIQKRAVSEGVIGADDDLLEPVFYFSPHLKRTEMEEEITKAWAEDTTKIFPVSDSLASINVMHKAGMVGPLWDKLL
ncbi:lipid biosynthesis B12-binding/radical SAM protein [Terasakiella sp. A23]|uniref:lipid biosynthesis B12-binding/radical SAM protein n=1 Tax=Terasakiella sp. FCG-A23 TaxID=3080561 RepID=UPI002953FE72|nr:lipid biosynthesis B12-binding/radical SAM protein [Terasakiella sp. A23]MDV7341037.1 lipid biosynthesis B12-binding/radical SAM protein [Terasakiella sp. A23]